MIRELVQSVGVAALTQESTKTESSAINAYKKQNADPSLDTA
jgi:erythromycin esterase-like protein